MVPGQGKAGKQADGGGRGSGPRLDPSCPSSSGLSPVRLPESPQRTPSRRPWRALGTGAGCSHSTRLALQEAKASALESGSQTRGQACVCPARPAPAPTEHSVNARGPSHS